MKTGYSTVCLLSCLKVACVFFLSAAGITGQQVHLPTLDITMHFNTGIVLEKSFDPAGLESMAIFDLKKGFLNRMDSVEFYDVDLGSFDFTEFHIAIGPEAALLPVTAKAILCFAYSYCDTPQIEYVMAATGSAVEISALDGEGQCASANGILQWGPGLDRLEECVHGRCSDKVFFNVWARFFDGDGNPLNLAAYGIETFTVNYGLKAFVKFNLDL